MVHVYGIKNCNTVKKALDWLAKEEKEYIFHDFKKEPATATLLTGWEKSVSWQLLLNKKGTTWRKLSLAEQESVVDADSANTLLIQNNSMIKRPIIVYPKGILLGFDEAVYTEHLS